MGLRSLESVKGRIRIMNDKAYQMPLPRHTDSFDEDEETAESTETREVGGDEAADKAGIDFNIGLLRGDALPPTLPIY